MVSRPGKFIVLEGIDGSGTTTQAKRLADWLLENRPRNKYPVGVSLTAEPTDTELGRLIRKRLKNPVSHRALTMLFGADRWEHYEHNIVPLLERGAIVVCDRYHWSTLAYQKIHNPSAWVNAVMQDVPEPDITILLDVDPEVAALRGDRDDEIFERLDYQRQVRENYIDIFDAAQLRANAARTPEKVLLLNANDDEEAVSRVIIEHVKHYL